MLKKSLIKLHWLLSSQFGFDPRRLLRALRGLPRFVSDWWKFRKGYSGLLTWMPCLHDRYEEGGTTKSEYFWQDLLVARLIFAAKPQRHVDIGSRVDGFVAHVASFRDIEVFDVRPISTQIPGVVFKQADLMRTDSLPDSGGGTVIPCHACMRSNTSGLAAMAIRLIPLAMSGASPTWRYCFSLAARFISPHPSVGSGWNSTPIAYSIRAASSGKPKATVWRCIN